MVRLRWAAAVALLATGGCGDGGSALVLEELERVGPAEPGTYRLVGAERDSRSGRSARMVETYDVEPYFTRDGVDHQITRYRDTSGRSGSWETAFRPTGAYRLRETAGDASWTWSPALRSVALPLRAGTSWRYRGNAVLPDLHGTRRTTEVRARSEVVATERTTIAGKRVFVFVVEASVTTTVTDTDRVTREATTFVTETSGRTWFSPEHRRAVRSVGTTTVRGRPEEGGGDYQLVREVEADEL